MYESPIRIIEGELTSKVENDIMTVVKSYGIDVDKVELVRALRYDREQYKKGFEDGKNSEKQNDPLTWDELKTMEGKPVWVEAYDPIDEKTGWHTASWKLIEFINDEYFDVRDSDGEQECFYKSENDCYCWRAYRKERTDEKP